jgi:hypothetical protein
LVQNEVFALFTLLSGYRNLSKYFTMMGTSSVVGRYPRTAQGTHMLKLISVQSLSAAAAAALIGSLAAFLTPVAPQARADTQAEAPALPRATSKGDRLPQLVTGRACSSKAWPNYDRGCQFDLRRSVDNVRAVRIVNMEKLVSPVIVASKQ